MKKKLFSLLALLIMAVSGAWAQEPVTEYSVTLAEGTEDADKWTVSPNPAAEGEKVTATYRGTKKVKSVKATVKGDPLATTLISNCYQQMFIGCSSLTAAPDLPAQTLASSCYRQMFNNCSNLASVKCLATNPGTYNQTWLNGAGSQVTGDKIVYTVSTADWSEGNNGIPSGWTRVNIDN